MKLMAGGALRKILFACSLVFFLAFVLNLFGKRFILADMQLDFTAYHSAVKLAEQGKSPYNPAELNRQMGLPADDLPFTYNYLPATLNFFRIFAWLDLPDAKRAFLCVKFLFFAGLIFIWGKIFALSGNSWQEGKFLSLRNFPQDPLFYLLSVFAFHRALQLDVRAGNITIIEQFFLWLGIWLLLRDRNTAAGAAVTAGGLWKLSPLVFLVFLPVQDRRKGFRNLFICSGIVLAFIAADFLLEPKLMQEFIANLRWVSQMDYTRYEPPVVTPSVSNFIYHYFPPGLRLPVKLFFSLLAGLAGFLALRNSGKLTGKDALFYRILLASLLYILLMPVRIKDYSYVMLIPAAYFAVRRILPGEALQWIAAILIMLHLSDFHSLWSALGIFCIFLWGIFYRAELFSPVRTSCRDAAAPNTA